MAAMGVDDLAHDSESETAAALIRVGTNGSFKDSFQIVGDDTGSGIVDTERCPEASQPLHGLPRTRDLDASSRSGMLKRIANEIAQGLTQTCTIRLDVDPLVGDNGC